MIRLRRRHQSGGILLEVVLAMAILVAAMAYTFRALSNAANRLSQIDHQRLAVDIAQSKLAELQAGLININDLRDTRIEMVGTTALLDEARNVEQGGLRWKADVSTQPLAQRGLSLVILTISEDETVPGALSTGVSVTLRQAMRLRDAADEAYEQDDLVDDLEARP